MVGNRRVLGKETPLAVERRDDFILCNLGDVFPTRKMDYIVGNNLQSKAASS